MSSNPSAAIALEPPRIGRVAVPAQGAWRLQWGWGVAWLFPLATVLLWEVAVRNGWMPAQVLPAPQLVASTLWELVQSGELWDNLCISMVRVFSGFAIGLGAGLALGIAMGLSPTVRDYVFPLFKAIAQVPVIGWVPLLVLLVGIDEALKFLLIAKAAMVPVAINTFQGIQGVPNNLVEVARVHRFSRWQLLSRVVFPAATAPIWSGMRLGLTNAWLSLVAVELLASSEGIGFLIVYGRQLFQLDVVLAAVVAVGLVGLILDKALTGVETWLLRWRRPGV